MSFRKRWKGAVVVDGDFLKELDQLLSPLGAEAAYLVVRSDDSTHEFKELSGVLATPNHRRRRIEEIRIKRSADRYAESEVRIRDDKDAPVEYSITGTSDQEYRIEDQLEGLLDRSRPWYSALVSIDFLAWIFGLALIIFVALIIAVPVIDLFVATPAQKAQPISRGDSDLFQTIFLGIIAAMFVAGVALNFVRDRLFPAVVFELGAGVRRYRILKWLHATLGAIVVGLFVIALAKLIRLG